MRWAWFLLTDECKELLANGYKLVYVSNVPLAQWQKDIWSCIIEEPMIRIEQSTQFSNVVLPDTSIYTTKQEQNYYTETYHKTIRHIVGKALERSTLLCGYDKLYLSQLKVKTNCEGEELIVKEAKKLGYKVISPERLSFFDQVYLLNAAKEVMCTEGSVSHATQFCKPGTQVNILRKFVHVNKYSLFINQMADLNVNYIDCSLSLLCPQSRWWAGPFFIYPNQQFCDCLQIKVPLFPIGLFKKYAKRLTWHPEISELMHMGYVPYAELLCIERTRWKTDIAIRLEKWLFFVPQNLRKRVVGKIIRLMVK